MRCLILTAASLALLATAAHADDWVNGYTRSNGTSVQGYERTTPDGRSDNNYSTRGNTNPYTGAAGTHTDRNFGGLSSPNTNNGYGTGYGSPSRELYGR